MSSPSPILLSIDIQAGMVTGSPSWGSRSTPNLTTTVPQILSFFRAHNYPVLHIQHDDLVEENNPISSRFPDTFQIDECAKPENGERVFVKHVGSAFFAEGMRDVLGELMRGERKRKVFCIGMDGAQCVNNSVRHGSDLGYEMVVIRDACSTYSIGKKFSAEGSHEAAMGMLEGYARVVEWKKLEAELREQSENP